MKLFKKLTCCDNAMGFLPNLVIGIGIGLSFGVALHDMLSGTVLGIGIGLALGSDSCGC